MIAGWVSWRGVLGLCALFCALLAASLQAATRHAGPEGPAYRSFSSPAVLQQPPPRRMPSPPTGPPPKTPEPVEKLGENLFRVGNVRIDTVKREVWVPGTVNDVQVLEFIANTKGGFKAYESALEIDTNAINFNLALILIGLDKAHASVPRFHFDPNPPQGDPVEVWVEWDEGGNAKRVRAEQLVYNEMTKQTLAEGPWVYTGSVFIDSVGYMADMDGVLIGFVHTPAPIIESPRSMLEGAYGANRLNRQLGLKPGTAVTLRVRALEKPKDKGRQR